MIRSAASKVMWVGRATVFLVGLAVILAVVLGVASTAFGANGGNFILGSLNNTATALTKLTGNVNGSAMQVVNNNPDANDSAVNLSVQSGEAPMKVNSTTKVASLNADQLDGKDATALALTTNSNHQPTGDTTTGGCTTVLAFNECAPVTVKVPAGKQYRVTVLSSFSLESTSTSDIFYCPAIQGGSFTALRCIAATPAADGFDFIDLEADNAESAASSGEVGPLPAGTYTFSTVINPSIELLSRSWLTAHTTVLVRDASAPGPPIN